MDDFRRHSRVFDPYNFKQPVVVVGCGGMGSRVAEGLVRMGVGNIAESHITLFDPDFFEEHNLTNQWVDYFSVNTYKVSAVVDQMRRINPQVKVTGYQKALETGRELEGVVFLCLDSMEVRRELVDSLEGNDAVSCVIETRMDAVTGISHCFDPRIEMHMECWRIYWFPDSKAQDLAGCNGPQSIISAIYGTTALALKQFEEYAATNTPAGITNRVYQDFVQHKIRSETWPVY